MSRPSVDLGPRPVLTIAAWFGICTCLGFLAYAVMGRAMWSDETLAVVPVKLALQFAFGLFIAAAAIFLGLQFGWFEPETQRATRRTRRTTTTRRRPSSTRRRTYR